MLAQTRNSLFLRRLQLALLAAGSVVMASCATKEKPPLIADPSSTGAESSLPWNQQQSWEQSGQMGQMADRMGGGRR
jgi:hypothetical protein